jgi:hypothetical protein
MRDFLWSKFWTGLLPILVFTELLTVTANQFLGVDPFLKVVAGLAIGFMAFALVGMATGLGARYPRFGADPTQAAGSYGGIAFMILGVLYIIVMIALLGWPSSLWMFSRLRGLRLSTLREAMMVGSFAVAAILSVTTWLVSMRSGIRALEEMDRK